jgi:hypothetical protein
MMTRIIALATGPNVRPPALPDAGSIFGNTACQTVRPFDYPEIFHSYGKEFPPPRSRVPGRTLIPVRCPDERDETDGLTRSSP